GNGRWQGRSARVSGEAARGIYGEVNMSKVFEGQLSAAGLRFPIVVSRFNSFITERLLGGAMDALTRGGTPAPVTIDEALELARKFSGEESVQFVNGVLDAVRREMT